MTPESAAKSRVMDGNSGPVGSSNAQAAGDDFAVIQRVRAGDASAFDVIVQRHGDRLHAMLYQLANHDADLAAELTQEAFVHAFAKLDRFAGASSFYTWLYRLARNRALDLLQRKKPRNIEQDHLSRADGAPSPHDRVAANDLRDQVRRGLAKLPPDQRELLLLREFEGLDYQRIAELMDVPEGTIKSRLSRARAALREALEGRVSAEDIA